MVVKISVVEVAPKREKNLRTRRSKFVMKLKHNTERTARFADMLSAMGTEPRLRIMQLLLTAHPDGLVVGDIQSELNIAPSTLSHHLEKLRHEDLVNVRRDKKYLWYQANADALQDLLGFLFSECCARNKAVKAEPIIQLCR